MKKCWSFEPKERPYFKEIRMDLLKQHEELVNKPYFFEIDYLNYLY